MRLFAFGIGIVGYALDPAVAFDLVYEVPEDFYPSCRADQGMPSLVFGKSVATAGWAETSLCVSVG